MFKILLFSLIAGISILAAFWIAQQPGILIIKWLGYEIDTSIGFLFVILVMLAGILYLLIWLCYALVLTPHRIRKAQANERRKNGYKALTKGMVALAAGDAVEAQRHAQKATLLMNDPPLTLLLTAQAAQLSGDEKAAAKYFQLMLDNPESAFLGYRGLLMQALRQKNYKVALDYTRKALKTHPKADWLTQTQFELETKLGEWVAAAASLQLLQKNKKLPQSQLERFEGLLLAETARRSFAEQPELAVEKAQAALKYIPHFIPALILEVKGLLQADKKKPAIKLIEKQWQTVQHPTLLKLYKQALQDQSIEEQLKRLEKLTPSSNPLSSDILLVLAEASIQAKAWPQARQYLQQIMQNGHKTAKACRLMAELEEGENQNYRAAMQWLTQASEASEEACWICQTCQTHYPEWQACCNHCQELDQLVWSYPSSPLSLKKSDMVLSLPTASIPLSPLPDRSNVGVEANNPKEEKMKDAPMMVTIVDSTPIMAAPVTEEKADIDSKAAINAARQVN